MSDMIVNLLKGRLYTIIKSIFMMMILKKYRYGVNSHKAVLVKLYLEINKKVPNRFNEFV